MNNRTWLVGYDFSDHSILALARAHELLSALGGGNLILGFVHEPASGVDGIDIGAIGTDFLSRQEAVSAAVERELAALILTLPKGNVTYESYVGSGRIGDGLVALAKERDVDQIVVGSHGRRGFQHFLIGSVAERVLRLADRSVLVVKGDI